MNTKRDTEELIKEYLAKPISIGESVYIENKDKNGRSSSVYAIVTGFNDNGTIQVKLDEDRHTPYWLNTSSVDLSMVKRNTNGIGENPIKVLRENAYFCQCFNYDIEGILGMLGYQDRPSISDDCPIPRGCMNPFVTLSNGTEYFYQRDLCWELEDKQDLIDSIYRGLDCGKIVIRERPYHFVERYIKNGGDISNVGLYEVVDGKQRIDTVRGFVHNEFPDKYGNYWKHLSGLAKTHFRNTLAFSTLILREDATDKDVISTLLNVNTRGKAYNIDRNDMEKNVLSKI